MRSFRHWRWHIDEVYVKINEETHYLWRVVDHEGEVLESYVTKKWTDNTTRGAVGASSSLDWWMRTADNIRASSHRSLRQ